MSVPYPYVSACFTKQRPTYGTLALTDMCIEIYFLCHIVLLYMFYMPTEL